MTVAPWKARPIFVSSTFVDMQSERDHLRNYVFPVLEDRLRERRHHLETIDLRWGVETVSVDEQRSKELLVLKVCLEEINRSRPFLIALIGDRYGWVPIEERMKAATQEVGFETDLDGKSVTSLEIEYGVLDSPDQRRRSLFYFRDPLPYDEMPSGTAALFSDAHAGNSDGAERLTALKERIRKEVPERWRSYRAMWDAEKNAVTGLDAWGAQVLEDIWGELDEETREFSRQPIPSWQEQELWALDQFVENRGRGFIGRTETVCRLLDHAGSPVAKDVPWGLCVTGQSGSGKSALFAHLYRKLLATDSLVLSQAAGISQRAGQIDSMLERWTEELADFLNVDNPLAQTEGEGEMDELTTGREDRHGPSGDDIEKAFHSLLGRAAVSRRVVLLIDALNQFERSSRAAHLTWLPRPFPPNARLIATTIPGSESEAFNARVGADWLALPPLDTSEAEQIATAVSARYHRTLNSGVLHVLLDKKRPGGDPAAGTPLWLEMALEELHLLDADDFARAEYDYSGSPEERLLGMMTDSVRAFPSDVEGMYDYMLERAEDLYGVGWTQGFANLIAVSRHGWRELDVRVLLPSVAAELDPKNVSENEDWDSLRFAALRRVFRAHLVQRGTHSQWDFFHAQMREAVRRRNISNPDAEKDLHRRVADYLGALPHSSDPVAQSEYMYHLIGCDNRTRAAQYYGQLSQGHELRCATATLADFILNGEHQSPNPGLRWTLGLLDEPCEFSEMADVQRGLLCGRFYTRLIQTIAGQVRTATIIEILRRVVMVQLAIEERIAGTLLDTVPAVHEELDYNLANSSSSLAEFLHKDGRDAEAIDYYQKAQRLYEKIYALHRAGKASHPNASTEKAAGLLADCLSAIGVLLERLGRDNEAKQYRTRALDIQTGDAQTAFTVGHDAKALISLAKTGERLVGTERKEEALRWYQEHLDALQPLWDESADLEEKIWGLKVCGRYASLLADSENTEDAAVWFDRACQVGERIYRQQPDARSGFGLSIAYEHAGDFFAGLGENSQALESYERTLTIRRDLYRKNPDISNIRGMAVTLNNVGNLLAAMGKTGESLNRLEEAHQLFEDQYGKVRNADTTRDVITSHWQLAKLYTESARTQEAMVHLASVQSVVNWAERNNLQLGSEIQALSERLRILSGSTLTASSPAEHHAAKANRDLIRTDDDEKPTLLEQLKRGHCGRFLLRVLHAGRKLFRSRDS